LGSEDLFHKRKAQRQQDAVRRNASRQPYDNVLIVCEGEKTEPYYFEDMRVCLDLGSTNIKVDGSCGSSPVSIVAYAKELFDNERVKSGNYDRVFCVFDRDQHETFHEALSSIDSINKQLKEQGYSKNNIFATIRSIPAFEYWFLLHFTPSTKPYEPLINNSVGDQVINDLKAYMPDYKKKQEGLYSYFNELDLISAAKEHSKRIFEASKKSGDINPSTNVHELVEYLESLKKRMGKG